MVAYPAAVVFQFPLTRSAHRAARAAHAYLLRQRYPLPVRRAAGNSAAPAQPAICLRRARPLGEYIQYQFGPVNYPGPDGFFQVALLRRCQIIVKDHGLQMFLFDYGG